MSRRKSEQIEFGSDSFLDITANIVGILIILIVIAGLRVSQAPLFTRHTKIELSEPEPLDIVSFPEIIEEIEEQELEVTEKTEIVQEIEEEPVPLKPDPQLQLEIEKREAELVRIQKEIQKQKSQFQNASRNSRQLQLSLAKVSSSRKEAIVSVKKSQHKFREQKMKLDQSQKGVEDLKEKLAELDKVKVPTKRIRHHFSPVSKEVQGDELHFRLSNNQISPIPLKKLLEDLKDQVYRQRNWLVKFNQHQGEVGPIDGFTLSYIVRREKTSVLDDLRSAQGAVRIGVKEWILNPESNLQAESAEEALKPGSQFLNSIQTASGNSTLTFWVYPDSYSIYRKIQSYAHQQHFQVAARPLPFGIPIAGSPSGSKSAGQ